eukprot:6486560-Amphidinium_carterae.1
MAVRIWKPGSDSPSLDLVQNLNDTLGLMRDLMDGAPKGQVAAKQPWIGSDSWNLMAAHKKGRRSLFYYNRYMRRSLMRLAWQFWCNGWDGDGFWRSHRTSTLAIKAVLIKTKLLAERRKLRRLLRADKNAWVQTACADIEAASRTDARQLALKVRHAVLPKSTHARATKRMPLLSRGVLHFTDDERNGIWLDYFEKGIHSKRLQSCPGFQLEWPAFRKGWGSVAETCPCFTLKEVTKAFYSLRTDKVSPDVCPVRLMRDNFAILGPLWVEYCNTLLLAGTVPESLCGGITTLLPKKPTVTECADFRLVTMQPLATKLLGSILRARILEVAKIDCSQFGMGSCPGVDGPHTMLAQIQAYTKQHAIPLALVFLDLSNAHDRLLKELVAKPMQQTTLESLLALGIDDELARSTLRKIAVEPSVLIAQGVHPAIEALVSGLLQGAWLWLSPGFGDAWIKSGTGTAQGGTLSALLFILLLQLALRICSQYIIDMDLALMIPQRDTAMLSLVPDSHIHVAPIAYHDDILMALVAETPSELLRKTRQLMMAVDAVFRDYNMLLNYKRNKSELILQLPLGEAKRTFTALNQDALAQNMSAPAIALDGVCLNITHSYLYLGLVATADMTGAKHVERRVALYFAQVKRFKRVLTSGELVLSSKIGLFRTHLLPVLVFGLQSLPRLMARSMRKLEVAYLSGLRLCMTACLRSGDSFRHWSAAQILGYTRQPPLEAIIMAARLRQLRRLIRAENPLLRACLGVTQGVRSWWTGVFHDLGLLQSCCADLANLPPPSATTWAIWSQAICLLGTSWAEYIRGALQSLTPHAPRVEDIPLGTVWDELQEDEGQASPETTCPLCNAHFATDRALDLHRRKSHGIEGIIPSRVIGTRCPSCFGEYGTRSNLLTHLRSCMACRLYVAFACEPVDAQTLKKARNEVPD